VADYLWWTDWTHYFVAGHRLRDMFDDGSQWRYFVIDDTVYQAGDWEFAGIENNKIIVQRLFNIVENRATMKSTFTLETCEIDL
jgi:hypothetical protein